MDHSKMDHSKMAHGSTSSPSTLIIPYEFPTPGDYRVWVQIKTGGQVHLRPRNGKDFNARYPAIVQGAYTFSGWH